ncbi:Cell division and transport-associated protein TolQ [Altererythrobacter xiamenensis]|uniref:Cell division and transport-associated protein TolQ n=1 Tax=Altererythrobacter xiamenensis TaxID=1316679 RepID=A0A1Y6F4J2_9SPHN|nr:protein TolQ [Altererythrobacter xiamenensis]SMQ69794.1 Cell division and transport-associated protein TolQ [Altererythrobacter xiamenensis]
MTNTLSFLAAAAGGSGRLNPLELFLQADIVVQAVMVGLLLASVWVWMIIVSFSLRMGGLERKSRQYEEEFWETQDYERMLGKRTRANLPMARVAGAGLDEWQRSTQKQPIDRDGVRQRLAGAMESRTAQEADDLAERLNFLATTGSVAPFVGLFGTVWGIMNSFFQIGAQESSSLAVVAPGISEALFATAIGLFAAIPAVIAYNRFSHRVNRYEARLQRFADRFHAGLSRELDKA